MSEYIWHYTSESTLIELLGKKKEKESNFLYGTLYNFCNDTGEITLGNKLLDTFCFDELDDFYIDKIMYKNNDLQEAKSYEHMYEIINKYIELWQEVYEKNCFDKMKSMDKGTEKYKKIYIKNITAYLL